MILNVSVVLVFIPLCCKGKKPDAWLCFQGRDLCKENMTSNHVQLARIHSHDHTSLYGLILWLVGRTLKLAEEEPCSFLNYMH